MNLQHPSDDLCLDYLHGELPAAEIPFFESHLDECSKCRQRVQEYRTILRSALPAIGDEVVQTPALGSLPWSIDEGEKRLYAAIQTAPGNQRSLGQVRGQTTLLSSETPSARFAHLVPPRTIQRSLAVAAAFILAIALGLSTYRIGLKRGQEQSHTVATPKNDDDATLKTQIERLTDERAQVESILRERETAISGLRAQLRDQKKQTEALVASLEAANIQSEERVRDVSSQRDDLARKLEDERTVAAAAQKKIDSIQQAQTNDALRVVNLENQIQQMSQSARDREGTIDEQQRMLAADRDIRDLMGARDLYIAEVYDVGGNGKRKKPYGRVFYTKGKSLIFYAYDLDQQPGLKTASTFQAWGLRGPDRSTALNLGVLYVDNSTNKRWVLRFDDPKALQEINAVFVTVEPNGGSRAPQGQQVLFAYLREEPNHP
jgi:anti-sigma factor RsiW